MGSFYRLLIDCDEPMKEKIDKVLGVKSGDFEVCWVLTIEEDSRLFNQALDYFAELIQSNLTKLKSIGITGENISFWYFYEYDQQCNMEFAAKTLRKIGNLDIALCISCWQK